MDASDGHTPVNKQNCSGHTLPGRCAAHPPPSSHLQQCYARAVLPRWAGMTVPGWLPAVRVAYCRMLWPASTKRQLPPGVASHWSASQRSHLASTWQMGWASCRACRLMPVAAAAPGAMAPRGRTELRKQFRSLVAAASSTISAHLFTAHKDPQVHMNSGERMRTVYCTDTHQSTVQIRCLAMCGGPPSCATCCLLQLSLTIVSLVSCLPILYPS